MKGDHNNPRWKGGKRRLYRERFKALGLPCAICKGELGAIDYTTSDAKAPLGFVVDEIIPISKYYLAGYNSKEEAANDWNNLQPAHRICNAMKGNKVNYTFKGIQADHARKQQQATLEHKPLKLDGKW